MTMHFNMPTSAADLASLSTKMQAEAAAMAAVSAALAQYETITGKALFVSASFSAPIKGGFTRGFVTKPPRTYPNIVVEVAAPAPTAVEAVSATVEHGEPKAAPAVKPEAPARPRHWAALPLDVRAVVLHLETLPPSFSAKDDRDIAEAYIASYRPGEVAILMGRTTSAVASRWAAFQCPAINDLEGKMTEAGKQLLLGALAYLVEVEG